jgi:hypothetical protein
MKPFEITTHGSEMPMSEGKIDLQERKARRKHKTTTFEDK